MKVVRDTNESQYVNVSWTAPVWTGYSKVSKVQVGVRNPAQRDVKWIDLPATATSAKIKAAQRQQVVGVGARVQRRRGR